jgi:malic enzyme
MWWDGKIQRTLRCRLTQQPGVAEVSLKIKNNPALARRFTSIRHLVAIVTDGTAVVVTAALLNAAKSARVNLRATKIGVIGLGAAGVDQEGHGPQGPDHPRPLQSQP